MKKLVTFIATLSVFLFVASSPTHAQENFRSGDYATLEESEVIDKDFFAGGDSVTVSGTVNGDAYVAGGDVKVDGDINGDLLVAGGNITISGNVSQDVRAFGGQITISGKIEGNLTVGAGNVNILEGAEIAGSIVGGAGSVNINSEVKKGMTIGAGDVVIDNLVGSDVLLYAENIRFTSNSEVDGNLTYYSQNDAAIDSNAKISGSVDKKETKMMNEKEMQDVQTTTRNGIKGVFSGFKVLGLLSFLIVSLLLIKFLPNFTKHTTKILEEKPFASLGWGFLFLIVFPIAMILVFITILGIPITFVFMPLYFIALYVAKFFTILWVGTKLYKSDSMYKSYLVGFLLFAVLCFIPVLSFFTKFFAMLFGLGAMLIAKKTAYEKMVSSKIL